MHKKYKFLGIGFIAIWFIAVTLLSYDGFFYTSEEDELIKKVEDGFDIDEIEYKEILYFMPFSGGPLGEGDSCLVLKLTEDSMVHTSEALQANDNIGKFPMEKDISDYAYDCMNVEKASFHLSELKQGLYGFYSESLEQLLSHDQVSKSIQSWNSGALANFIYIQYDERNGIIYIWEYCS